MKANPTQPAQTAWTPLEFSLASERLITWLKQTSLEERSGNNQRSSRLNVQSYSYPLKETSSTMCLYRPVTNKMPLWAMEFSSSNPGVFI